MSAVARMIEVAVHNGAYEGDALVVFDGLVRDRYNGVRLEVEHTTGELGWSAYCRDGVGTGKLVWVPESMGREEACKRALDGYLDIKNNGI